jgi:hypothetical protein
MDAAKRSMIGYRVSDNRWFGSCIIAMRMAFRHFKELPKTLSSLPMDTAPILSLLNSFPMNSMMLLNLMSH